MDTLRKLSAQEIATLEKGGNSALSGWDALCVESNGFDASKIRNCCFEGEVNIGSMSGSSLSYDGLRLPVGLHDSYICDCTIGDDCAIYNVRCLSGYIIGKSCLFFDVHEICSREGASWGSGSSIEMNVMNEAGDRVISPFAGMLTADAYLWAKYADIKDLQSKLREYSDKAIDKQPIEPQKRGIIGKGCVIKGTGSVRDCRIGDYCTIDGASKLRNLSILSREGEEVVIGENVILCDGIMGPKSRALHACMAFKFVIGNNSCLKLGARLMESVLGDNSTVACCETSNNIIFPAHEQHHNSSFLIAACIMGQSNLASGTTIGSNHNSRTCDGEIVAGRGFWPGLCVSLKHSSVFASYCLIAKGDYPAEIKLDLPFCLVNNNITADRLEIMPAYWWMYNMYALARNNWKFGTRDKRVSKEQHIEFATYAPDSMEEALGAVRKLSEMLKASPNAEGLDFLDLPGRSIENSKRTVRILKPNKALEAYRQMIVHYLMINVLAVKRGELNIEGAAQSSVLSTIDALYRTRGAQSSWVNLGGQLIPESAVEQLQSDIISGVLGSWEEVHQRYDSLWESYPVEKLLHAYSCVCRLYGVENLDTVLWEECVEIEKHNQKLICQRVRDSRAKDYENSWRNASYRNSAEMNAVIGTLEDDKFLKQIALESESNISVLDTL